MGRPGSGRKGGKLGDRKEMGGEEYQDNQEVLGWERQGHGERIWVVIKVVTGGRCFHAFFFEHVTLVNCDQELNEKSTPVSNRQTMTKRSRSNWVKAPVAFEEVTPFDLELEDLG